ncbi:MAG: hypothetical protein M1812_006006 [Candelaria pacifica]|nr:MAG: hypothetical protein M1812_006006 [Candelaria pacifica]
MEDDGKNMVITFYTDVPCIDAQIYGILPNANGAIVALTNKASKQPATLNGGKKYPPGEDVVDDMKAFKVGRCAKGKKWSKDKKKCE